MEYQIEEKKFEKLLVATNNLELINSYYDFKRSIIIEMMKRLEIIDKKIERN